MGQVAGTGQNETHGLSDVGEDGVMKGLRTSDRDVGAWIPVLHSKYWKAVLQPGVMAQGPHCSLPSGTSPAPLQALAICSLAALGLVGGWGRERDSREMRTSL